MHLNMHFCSIWTWTVAFRLCKWQIGKLYLSHPGWDTLVQLDRDLLSICIHQTCSHLFSSMCQHPLHPHLLVSLHLNRVILHGSSSGVARVVNHSSRLLILLSTSSPSSSYQRTGLSSTPPWPHSVIYVIKSTPAFLQIHANQNI